jgi:hypothetical protein
MGRGRRGEARTHSGHPRLQGAGCPGSGNGILAWKVETTRDLQSPSSVKRVGWRVALAFSGRDCPWWSASPVIGNI